MSMGRRLAIISSVAVLPLLGAAPVSAHVIEVTTPSGEHSQFLGGPGNPGHAGHHGGPSGNGHLAACEAAEAHSVVDFVDAHFGSCVFP